LAQADCEGFTSYFQNVRSDLKRIEAMSKGQDSKKNVKKKPLLTAKEKKAAKKSKKDDNNSILGQH
jgi:hypothetical protein